MKNVILGGIALGALGLLAKKALDCKAEKEGYDSVGEYMFWKSEEAFESIEDRLRHIDQKVKDWIDTTDFSTIDKIDEMLGGRITNALEKVGNIVEKGTELVDEWMFSSTLFSPTDKACFALSNLDESIEKSKNEAEKQVAWDTFKKQMAIVEGEKEAKWDSYPQCAELEVLKKAYATFMAADSSDEKACERAREEYYNAFEAFKKANPQWSETPVFDKLKSFIDALNTAERGIDSVLRKFSGHPENTHNLTDSHYSYLRARDTK